MTTASKNKMELAVVLNAHENSPVFKDTLESVRHYWTDNVLVVVDGKNWVQFRDDPTPAMKLEGFHHDKDSSPYRNMCLGLLKAWEIWGGGAEWYAYMEYDCLVGSSGTLDHLRKADEMGFWILGNDYREDARSIPFLNQFEGSDLRLKYLLGCCLFFSNEFMKHLAERDFFHRFLNFTNFHDRIFMEDSSGKNHDVYDLSEFMYPTLAVHYGGKVGELACWANTGWRGNHESYPMRFRPDLSEEPFERACVLHPLKHYENPVRSYHRLKRIHSPGRTSTSPARI